MAVTLTGPFNCAECGTGLTLETTLAGDADHFYLNIRGHRIEVPGLYVCTPCAGAVMVGEKESSVTLEAARDFLNDIYGPRLVVSLLTDDDDPEMALSRLNDVMEVQFVLEACIMLRDEPGGLDFIPECNGHCGELHPRDMATMN